MDQDGVSNYDEIKRGTDIRFPGPEGILPYEYILEPISRDGNRECFRLQVNNITVYGEDNMLVAYIVEAATAVNTEKRLRTAKTRIKNGMATFLDEDFQ